MNWINEFKFRQYYKEGQNDTYGCQKFLTQWLQKKKKGVVISTKINLEVLLNPH